MNHRLSILGAVLVGAAAIGALAPGDPPQPPAAGFFADLRRPTTPYVPLADWLTSSFFCAGVPAAAEGAGGELVVVNPTEEATRGEVTLFSEAGTPIRIPLDVPARGATTVDIGRQAPSGFVGALVELAGSGALVEQRATLDGQTSVAPCANDAARSWDLPAGTTLDARYQLVLTNPFPGAAVVALTIATSTDTRAPNEFQNYVVPGNSVRVIQIDQVARDEELLAIHLQTSRGRVVAGRAQVYDGARSGSSVALGGAGSARQWLFADGEQAPGITERYVITNTGEQIAAVDVSFFAATPGEIPITPVSLDIAPGRTAIVDPATLGLQLSGRYAASVAGAGDASLVVEHEITRDGAGTAVSLGSRFGSRRWWVPIGYGEAIPAGLIVFNASGLDGAFTISTLGPGGAQPIPSITDVPLGAAATVAVDLPLEAVGVPLLIESAALSLVVEQRPPAGSGLRSGGLAIPE